MQGIISHLANPKCFEYRLQVLELFKEIMEPNNCLERIRVLQYKNLHKEQAIYEVKRETFQDVKREIYDIQEVKQESDSFSRIK